MFRLTQKLSKGLWAFFAVLAVSVSLFSSLMITTQPAHAADKQAVKTPCVGDGVSTGYKSPFSKTSNMCLGDEASTSRRFFQFAIKLEKGADVSVTAKSGSGSTISFVKESDTLYVSKPGSNSMGYAGFVLGTNPACSSSDKNNKITITTKGPGSNNTDTKEINLCSYKNSASDSLIYQTASLKGVSSTGTILGNLGVERSDSLVPENKKKATIEKDYVTKFTLEGPTKIDGNNRLPASGSGGFDLSNGRLSIGQLQPGNYNLKIVYNDKAAMSASGGDPGLTKEIAFTFNDINVRAGGTVWIGGSNASLVKYTTTDAADTNQTTEEDSVSSCKIDGVGWIICPVLTFMGGIVDGAYYFVSGLLVVQPLVTTSSSADDQANRGIYTAWSVMRNIANIAFVIAFLIIIFSQLTNFGVSNYGVKKLLPRLVVAAVLVNLSFWVSAIAVDLSNIAGASTVQIFDSVQQEILKSTGGTVVNGDLLNGDKISIDDYANGGQWTDLIGLVLVGSITAYYVPLAALIPALLAAVFAIVTVFLVLTLRQAIIILLIVISPLAFVAYLLPNTEDLFTKWRKLFMTLLLMYPIIAGIFGASALASMIIMQGADGNLVIQIMGACIAILPLAITPLVMKTAGGLLNRFGGIVNNTERGPLDRLKKVGAAYGETRSSARNSRALRGDFQGGRGAFVRWRARRGAVSSGIKAENGRNQQQYIADAMTVGDTDTPTKFAKNVAGATSVFGISTANEDPAALQRALAGAKFTIEKAEFEDVKAEQSLVSSLDMSQLKNRIEDPTATGARKAAIIDRMIKIGEPKEYAKYINQYGNDQSEESSIVRRTMANSLRESGPQFLKASDLDDISTGKLTKPDDFGVNQTRTFKDIAIKNTAAGVTSQEKMVGEASVNLTYQYSVADQAGKNRLQATAKELLANDNLKGKIKHNVSAIEGIANGTLYIPPEQPTN
jgi:hypothetical protein